MSRSKFALLFASFLICFSVACNLLGGSPTATVLPATPAETAAVATKQSPTFTTAAPDAPLPSPTLPATPTVAPTTDPFPTVNPWDGALLNWIPAGSFTMGANPGSIDFWGAEAPAHSVTLDAFVMYRYEVTNAMYQTCVKAAVCSSPRTYSSPGAGLYFTNSSFDDYPVIYVSYEEAATYCEWAGGRLPSEAEWEKAARGEDGRLYPWGDDPLDATRANFCGQDCPHDSANADLDDGYPDLAPVGSFPAGASPYGVMDMGGNVLEWTADWYQADYYATSPAENPQGPASGSKHPIRGGSWFNDQTGLRTAARASMNPGDAADTLGFRCALPADVAQWRGLPTTPTPRPTPENLPQFNPIDQASLAFIPAGNFIMGADPGSPMFWGAEAPSHLVSLDDYLIYRTEVTNAMYLTCVDAGVCTVPVSTTSQTRPEYWDTPEFADYPVIYVSHTAASNYCTWAGGRLPTEAEWEKAARGTDGRLFPWNDDWIDFTQANFCLGDCINMSEEDARQPGSPDTDMVVMYSGDSPYGVHDMAGNVGEWVADWFRADYYSVSPSENPTGPATGERRVIRGGSWLNDPSALRAAARSSEVPYSTFNTVGFRCVMDVSAVMELPQQAATATPAAVAELANPHLVIVAEQNGRPAVYAINPDGSQLTRLTQGDVPEMVAGRSPFFLSPDGKRVVFYGYDYPNRLYAMNVDGSQLSVVKEASQGTSDNERYLWRARLDGCKIAWSPDGTQLAFMSSDQENWALQVETFDLGNGKTSIYTWPDLYYDPFACYSINWSPDGKFLAFNASIEEGPDISSPDGRLIKLNLADGKIEFLSDIMALSFMGPASWSPDGKTIAYSHVDGTIVLAAGQNRTIKKFDQYMSGPVWSPSGSFLLSQCESGLCRFESDGEVLTPIEINHVSSYNPSWALSPDEQLIAYVDDEIDSLYLVSSDGSGEETRLMEDVLSNPIWQTSGQAALPLAAIQPPPTATPTPLPTLPAVSVVKTRLAPIDGMVQAYIPAGEFLMGLDQAFTLYGLKVEEHMPEHRVYLDAYWIDQTEVTNSQYKLCLDAGGCTPLVDDMALNDPYGAAMPVTLVDRDQAIAYCRWAGRQLPTEAQWEKAARGTDGRRYPWGNQEPDSTLADRGGGIDIVGKFPAGVSPYGAFDMQGNAAEWLFDIHVDDYYGRSPYENPPGPKLPAGEMYPCYGVRDDAVLRTCYEENMHASSIGFRCVQTP